MQVISSLNQSIANKNQ